jgi:hypothetical protein
MLTSTPVLAMMVKVCLRYQINYQISPLLLQSVWWLLISSVCLVLYPNSIANFFAVRRETIFPLYPGDVYPNETLLRHGYIGCSPVQPTLAISFRTLAAYCQSHRTCPWFSIEAQCKMLSHMHNVRKFPAILILIFTAVSRYLTPLTSPRNFPQLTTRILISADMLATKSKLLLDSIPQFRTSNKPARVASINRKMNPN